MPSVTEILSYLTDSELLKWIENNSKAKRKKITDLALRVGKEVDLFIQQDIKDGGYLAPEGDEPVLSCLKGWELFKKEKPWFVPGVKHLQKELEHEDVIGHPDFIYADIDRWGIIDLKCSRFIMPDHWVQTAKYYEMERLINSRKLGFIAILRLDKESGLYEYREITGQEDIHYEIGVFEAYHTIYQHKFKNREIIRQQLEEELLQ